MNIYSSNYYVYAYLRENGTPYYIGKGTKNRAWNKHKNINLPPNKNNIIILESNLTEQQAFDKEKQLIKKYGRKNINTGILINRTDGGTGGNTIQNHPNKKQIIKKIIETNKNNPKHKKFSKDNPNWGNKYKHTNETKKLISEKISGRKLSDIHKNKLKEVKKKTTNLKGFVFESRTEAAKYFGVSCATICKWLKDEKNDRRMVLF